MIYVEIKKNYDLLTENEYNMVSFLVNVIQLKVDLKIAIADKYKNSFLLIHINN